MSKFADGDAQAAGEAPEGRLVTPSHPFGIFRKIEAGVAHVPRPPRVPVPAPARERPWSIGPGQSEGRAVRCDWKARPTTCGIREVLGQELVYVVVVTVLNARTDAAGPRGPQAVADPALAEGRNARRGPVRRIASVEGVREIEVLDLDRVACCGYPREDVCVAADGGEGVIVLDPAQHVRYTGCV